MKDISQSSRAGSVPSVRAVAAAAPPVLNSAPSPPSPAASQRLHLVQEPSSSPDPTAVPRVSVQSPAPFGVAVPVGVSFLLVPALGALGLVSVPPESFDDVLILESLVAPSGQLRLVLLNPASGHLRVNGQPVPRVALLREKDEFSLNFGPPVFVTTWREPRVTSPDPVLLGKPCGVCRLPLGPGSLAYHCQCGCGLHCDPVVATDDALRCAALVDFCPSCRSALIRESGFAWLPDFSHA